MRSQSRTVAIKLITKLKKIKNHATVFQFIVLDNEEALDTLDAQPEGSIRFVYVLE